MEFRPLCFLILDVEACQIPDGNTGVGTASARSCGSCQVLRPHVFLVSTAGDDLAVGGRGEPWELACEHRARDKHGAEGAPSMGSS